MTRNVRSVYFTHINMKVSFAVINFKAHDTEKAETFISAYLLKYAPEKMSGMNVTGLYRINIPIFAQDSLISRYSLFSAHIGSYCPNI